MSGKWDDPTVPKRGWVCVEIDDLGEPSRTCEMCEVQTIRYVHTMEHPHYGTLAVGCICAGHMEEDLEAARSRERALKLRSGERKRWLRRKWRISQAGNEYLNIDDFNVVVFERDRAWGARVRHVESGLSEFSVGYQTADAAKLAAFDRMLMLKALP